MANAATDSVSYLDDIPFAWLYCRGWGHDTPDKPSARNPKAITEVFDDENANHEFRAVCANGCGYSVRYRYFVTSSWKVIELDPEREYENPEYLVNGFRVDRAEARARVILHFAKEKRALREKKRRRLHAVAS